MSYSYRINQIVDITLTKVKFFYGWYVRPYNESGFDIKTPFEKKLLTSPTGLDIDGRAIYKDLFLGDPTSAQLGTMIETCAWGSTMEKCVLGPILILVAMKINV